MPNLYGDGLEQMTREELIRECRNKQSLINFLNKPEPDPLPRRGPEALAIPDEEVEAEVESEALALLRELNDALVIPGWLQPRVDAILDRHEKEPTE